MASFGGGDHSETIEMRPDGETQTLTDIAPGFEIYGYKGEKLRGFVPTLPGVKAPEGWPCGIGGASALTASVEDVNGDGVSEVLPARMDGLVRVRDALSAKQPHRTLGLSQTESAA